MNRFVTVLALALLGLGIGAGVLLIKPEPVHACDNCN